MKFYELTYLISPKLTESEAKNFSEKITDLIKKGGGVVSHILNPQKRKLAYQIQKSSEGFLANIEFYFAPEKLESITQKMKSEDTVLRSLLFTKKQPKKAEVPKIPEIGPVKIKKEEKVALEDIEKKLEEILGES